MSAPRRWPGTVSGTPAGLQGPPHNARGRSLTVGKELSQRVHSTLDGVLIDAGKAHEQPAARRRLQAEPGDRNHGDPGGFGQGNRPLIFHVARLVRRRCLEHVFRAPLLLWCHGSQRRRQALADTVRLALRPSGTARSCSPLTSISR